MGISVVQLGRERAPDEGTRIGTVRRPPRGVPKGEFGIRNYYDVWLPVLSPSAELMVKGKSADSELDWAKFVKAYRAEMTGGQAEKVLDLLVAFSKTTNFSVGCYCENEKRCHRSILHELFVERGALMR
ncbi:TPA: DUF488 family protein [Pseudomonas aeruginosa]|nr:DUF488 family protein [Raoultella ornithinolytica]HEP8974289.1 DUF488 family protein [Pseudomonas aeruginosa]